MGELDDQQIIASGILRGTEDGLARLSYEEAIKVAGHVLNNLEAWDRVICQRTGV